MSKLPNDVSEDGDSVLTAVLHQLLRDFDQRGDRTFSWADIQSWPDRSCEVFEQLGILREVERAKAVCITDCFDQPFAEPLWTQNPDGSTIGAYSCGDPECAGVHYVQPEETRQWRTSFEGVAECVSAALRLKGRVTIHIPDRVATIGTLTDPGRTLVLLRGAGRSDFRPNMLPERLHAKTAICVACTDGLPQPQYVEACGSCFSLTESAKIQHGSFWLLQSALPDAPSEYSNQKWLTVTEAASLLLNDISGLDLNLAKARVSANAERGKFRTNSKQKRDRRIDSISFDAWRLAQREADLERADEEL